MHLKKRDLRNLVPVLLIAAVLILIAVCSWLQWEKPPEIQETPAPSAAPEPEKTPEPAPEETPEPLPEGEAISNGRQDGVYTILLAGIDQMSKSTDTILVGKIDTVQHTMHFVSIPRDTITNADIDVRKINNVYIGSLNFGGNGIDALSMQVRWLTGFEPDCYAVVDLNTFIRVIDELGGVDFDVPQEVEYFFDDIEKRLYIHLDPGYQHLDGLQAMAVCRYRTGYINADYGRMDVQHAFLKACAEQFISLGSIPHARAVIRELSDGMDTNLSAANIAWLLRQAVQCRSEDITFETMPSVGKNLQGYSYAVPLLGEWMTLLNRDLNPYDREIGSWELNMVYWDGFSYGCTGDLQGSWYFE